MPASRKVLESARELIARENEASLGTIEGEIPYVSVTSYLFEPGEGERLGSIYLLLSDLARHTKNLKKNKTVSLLIVESKPEVSIQQRARVTVVGEIAGVSVEGEKRLREKFRRALPWSEMWLSLPDFHFYRLRPSEVSWIGGFAQAQSIKIPA